MSRIWCFKPCYKWNTFNTKDYTTIVTAIVAIVLNLVISGIPSIQDLIEILLQKLLRVLNLVISGIPSIPKKEWLIFGKYINIVLNLVISGIPSIHQLHSFPFPPCLGFKPCYKWNTFNTLAVYWANSMTPYISFKPCYKWNTFNT